MTDFSHINPDTIPTPETDAFYKDLFPSDPEGMLENCLNGKEREKMRQLEKRLIAAHMVIDKQNELITSMRESLATCRFALEQAVKYMKRKLNIA